MTKVSNPPRYTSGESSGLHGTNYGTASSSKRPTGRTSPPPSLQPVLEDEEDRGSFYGSHDGTDIYPASRIGSVKAVARKLVHQLDYSNFRFPAGESAPALTFTERARGEFTVTRLAFIGVILLLLIVLTIGVIVEMDADRARLFSQENSENSINIASFPELKEMVIRTKYFASVSTQKRAVEDLASRLFTPEEAARFSFEVIPGLNSNPAIDSANITSEGTEVTIACNSGTACGWALYHFLKYYCSCHVAWSGRQIKLPAVFPAVSYVVSKKDPLQYYQNTCTSSYSFVWWNWTRWEQEIDWMVLQGINFPLAFTGQEEIWRRVYESYGLTDKDLESFFTGPAFLAWNRMGNIKSWGGPLPRDWMTDQLVLQNLIVSRMLSFGMSPILPAFNGIIPSAMLRVHPDLKTTALPSWGHFADQYTKSVLLDPKEPIFVEIGEKFIAEMRLELKYTSHFYNVDSFNENRPPENSSLEYVAEVTQATFEAMTKVDPDAIWVMQAWLFVYDPQYWTPERTKALLTGVPQGRMLLLDLDAENNPTYNTTDFFYGQPFIWCMLHNFGGVSGLFGKLPTINEGPSLARTAPGSTMVGVGITPEGINQNELVYEFMNEMSWREPVDLDSWVRNYTDRRLGLTNSDARKAYKLLQDTVYSCPYNFHNHGQYVLTSRPAFNRTDLMWYEPTDVQEAWRLLLRTAKSPSLSSTFLYDLVDVTRQNLQQLFYSTYQNFSRSFTGKHYKEATREAKEMEAILTDLEHLLDSDPRFRLKEWVESARNLGRSENQSDLYEYNALNQITLWGPNGEILDYAAKQWSGLMSKYYSPRWQLFLNRAVDSLRHDVPFDQAAFNTEVFRTVEEPFTLHHFEAESSGASDPISISSQLYDKYFGSRNSKQKRPR